MQHEMGQEEVTHVDHRNVQPLGDESGMPPTVSHVLEDERKHAQVHHRWLIRQIENGTEERLCGVQRVRVGIVVVDVKFHQDEIRVIRESLLHAVRKVECGGGGNDRVEI